MRHSVRMNRRTPVDPVSTGVPLRFRELTAAGVPPSRLRALDVAHPFRGIHVVGRSPAGLLERAEAFAPLMRPADAFSHTTAAALHGVPLPPVRDIRLHVTTIGGGDRVRRPGIVGHRAEALPVGMLGGLAVVDPAHAWVQLAPLLGHDDLVAAGDHLVTPQRVARRPALTSLDALAAAIPARARGATRARRALADVRVGAGSRMETLLRLLLMRSGLPEPRLNPAVRIGNDVLHPDLLYPQWRVVLEYEGDGHRTDPRHWRRDIWRREVFESAGWRVIRVHRDDVLGEPEAFLARVCRVLAQRQTP